MQAVGCVSCLELCVMCSFVSWVESCLSTFILKSFPRRAGELALNLPVTSVFPAVIRRESAWWFIEPGFVILPHFVTLLLLLLFFSLVSSSDFIFVTLTSIECFVLILLLIKTASQLKETALFLHSHYRNASQWHIMLKVHRKHHCCCLLSQYWL